MTGLHIAPICSLDARDLADLLNTINTATRARTADDIRKWLDQAGRDATGQTVRDEAGTLLAFQWIARQPGRNPRIAHIATFQRPGSVRLGSRLFDATCAAAKKLGYTWIDATIDDDNHSALTYYQCLGFETLARTAEPGKTTKRFEL